jgi:hypothetical protein
MIEEASHSVKKSFWKVTTCCSLVWCYLVNIPKEDVRKNITFKKAIILKKIRKP